jgi:tetratricopeptide (TPR) repeat protein
VATIRKSLLSILLGGSVLGLAQQPTTALPPLFAAAQQAQARGDYAAAVNDYTQAAKMRPDMPIVWANLGLSQQEAGNIPAAIEAFQRANRLDPSLYVPNLFLGIDYAHQGKAMQAVPFLIKAEKTNRADAQAPLALGRAYISARDYIQAIPQLEHALTLNPDLGTAWFDLGIAQLDQVETDARTISVEDKQSPFAGALYAESLMKQARFGEAASLYKTLLDAQTQPPCLHSELGFALLREHDEAGAAAAFAAERAAHPECTLALLGEARLAADRQDAHQAFSLLQQVLGRDRGFLACSAGSLLDGMASDEQSAFLSSLADAENTTVSADLRQALVTAFNSSGDCSPQPSPDAIASGRDGSAEEDYASGQFAACAHHLQRETGPASAGKLRLLASCSFFAGDNRSAARAAAALRIREPHSAEALYWSIRANERLAFQSLGRFQQLEPDSVRSHVLLGDIYQQLERFDDAQGEYQKALAASPSNEAAMLGLASAYLSNYNPKGALAVAQKALVGSPNDPELNLVMGQALLDQREFDQAVLYLQKSLSAKPQMLPRIHALIGKAYAETGKTKEAIAELNLGASSDEDGSVQYLLFQLYRQTGDVKDAQAALARMETIKRQREARGVKRVEDPDLSPIEQASNRSTTP